MFLFCYQLTVCYRCVFFSIVRTKKSFGSFNRSFVPSEKFRNASHSLRAVVISSASSYTWRLRENLSLKPLRCSLHLLFYALWCEMNMTSTQRGFCFISFFSYIFFPLCFPIPIYYGNITTSHQLKSSLAFYLVSYNSFELFLFFIILLSPNAIYEMTFSKRNIVIVVAVVAVVFLVERSKA